MIDFPRPGLYVLIDVANRCGCTRRGCIRGINDSVIYKGEVAFYGSRCEEPPLSSAVICPMNYAPACCFVQKVDLTYAARNQCECEKRANGRLVSNLYCGLSRPTIRPSASKIPSQSLTVTPSPVRDSSNTPKASSIVEHSRTVSNLNYHGNEAPSNNHDHIAHGCLH